MSQEKFQEYSAHCIQHTGINPSMIYCQSTGRIIGELSPSEMALIAIMIPDDMAPDQIADDLYIRTLSSMRPSPAFNYIRADTMNQMRVHAPADLASYLLNRMMIIPDRAYSGVRRSLNQKLQEHERLIKLHEKMSTLDFTTDDTARWFLHYLIELDSRFNLYDMTDQKIFPLDLDSWHLSNLALYNEALADLIESLQSRKDKLEREARLHESWLRNGGNRSMRNSHVSSFFELKPVSEATQRKIEKEKHISDIKSLLRKIMDAGSESEAAPAPKIILPKVFPNGALRLKINRGIN